MDARFAFELETPHSLHLNPYVEPFGLTSLQKLSVIEALQEEISVKAMLTNFAVIVAKFVQVSSVRFNSGKQNYNIDLNKQHHFFQSFTIFNNKNLLGKMTYTSKKKLNKNDHSLLKELNTLLARSLNLALAFHQLELKVKNDHLTELGNRAHFDDSLKRAIEQNTRQHTGLVLMLMDLNKFKQVNDTYGHKAGDRVLMAFAQVLNQVIRTSDLAFRFGGDEFALILQPASSEAALKVTSRLNTKIASHPVLVNYKVNTAVGFSNWDAGQSAETLFEQADKKLYQNK